jgi:hypothetical protein
MPCPVHCMSGSRAASCGGGSSAGNPWPRPAPPGTCLVSGPTGAPALFGAGPAPIVGEVAAWIRPGPVSGTPGSGSGLGCGRRCKHRQRQGAHAKRPGDHSLHHVGFLSLLRRVLGFSQLDRCVRNRSDRPAAEPPQGKDGPMAPSGYPSRAIPSSPKRIQRLQRDSRPSHFSRRHQCSLDGAFQSCP